MPKLVPTSDLAPFGKVVRAQGRTYRWLADQTGYSAKHIYRVATGRHPGTVEFHRAMWRVLRVRYPLPKEVLS